MPCRLAALGLGLPLALGPRLGPLAGLLGLPVRVVPWTPPASAGMGFSPPDLAKVARLRGLASPDSAVEWVKECRRAMMEANSVEQ